MCSLKINGPASELASTLSPKDQTAFRTRLARMAEESTPSSTSGLESLLMQGRVDAWQDIPDLKNVRKYRIGLHRFYITGHNTSCNYDIMFILINKRDKDDQPFTKRYQNMVRTAISDPRPSILIPVPRGPEEIQQAELAEDANNPE
jgi:hypothetical protein